MKQLFDLNNVKITIDYLNKTISSLIFNNEELIHGDIPFFTVKMRTKNAEKHRISCEIRCFLVAEAGLEPAASGL